MHETVSTIQLPSVLIDATETPLDTDAHHTAIVELKDILTDLGGTDLIILCHAAESLSSITGPADPTRRQKVEAASDALITHPIVQAWKILERLQQNYDNETIDELWNTHDELWPRIDKIRTDYSEEKVNQFFDDLFSIQGNLIALLGHREYTRQADARLDTSQL